MAALTAAGLVVTFDWTEQRINDGRPDGELSTFERETIASALLAGIRSAHVVWIMMPADGVVTKGAYCEIGYSIGQCRPLIVSEDDKSCAITALARRSFATHDEAADYLIEAQRRQMAYERLDWTVGL